MSVVIKVTDMSDNSVKFYNDMIEFMNEFYSEEDYNADCEDYQDRDSSCLLYTSDAADE